jgi:hypothetical protein
MAACRGASCQADTNHSWQEWDGQTFDATSGSRSSVRSKSSLVFKNKRESESWASAPRTSVDVRVSVALAFMTDAVVLAPEGHKRASECFFS